MMNNSGHPLPATVATVVDHIGAALGALEAPVLAGLLTEDDHREVWERLEDAQVRLMEALGR